MQAMGNGAMAGLMYPAASRAVPAFWETIVLAILVFNFIAFT